MTPGNLASLHTNNVIIDKVHYATPKLVSSRFDTQIIYKINEKNNIMFILSVLNNQENYEFTYCYVVNADLIGWVGIANKEIIDSTHAVQ